MTRLAIVFVYLLSYLPVCAGAAILADAPMEARRIACELVLSASPREALVRLFARGELAAVDGDHDYDFTGIVHTLAGVSYAKVRENSQQNSGSFRAQLMRGIAHYGGYINTPVRLLSMIDKAGLIRPGQTVVDLGSGHGAPGLIFGGLEPEVNWIGLEYSAEKVAAANRAAEYLELRNVHFEVQDIFDAIRPLRDADLYYMMRPVLEQELKDLWPRLREVALRHTIRILAIHPPDFALQADWLEIDVEAMRALGVSISATVPEILVLKSRAH